MRIVPTGKAYPVDKIMEAMDAYIYVCENTRRCMGRFGIFIPNPSVNKMHGDLGSFRIPGRQDYGGDGCV
jgi:hypothetical protein